MFCHVLLLIVIVLGRATCIRWSFDHNALGLRSPRYPFFVGPKVRTHLRISFGSCFSGSTRNVLGSSCVYSAHFPRRIVASCNRFRSSLPGLPLTLSGKIKSNQILYVLDVVTWSSGIVRDPSANLPTDHPRIRPSTISGVDRVVKCRDMYSRAISGFGVATFGI